MRGPQQTQSSHLSEAERREARGLRWARAMPSELLLAAVVIIAVVAAILIVLDQNDRRH